MLFLGFLNLQVRHMGSWLLNYYTGKFNDLFSINFPSFIKNIKFQAFRGKKIKNKD